MEGLIIKEIDLSALPESEKNRILDMRDERDAINARLSVANKKQQKKLRLRLE